MHLKGKERVGVGLATTIWVMQTEAAHLAIVSHSFQLCHATPLLVWSGLQLSGGAPHRLGTPHRAQTHGGSNNKNYIIHRRQTYLYLGLPYTENTGQINLDNVT